MRLADARTGPTALTLAPPSYPMDAVRSGVEATVTVTVEVNADGSPRTVETAYENSGKSRSPYYRKAFLASATEAVKRWPFRPELVAGHVVPGSPVPNPLNYCLGASSSNSAPRHKTPPAESKQHPRQNAKS